MEVVILLFECRDQKGIVAAVTDFILTEGGNIIALDQHSTSLEGGHFFLRLEFCVAVAKKDEVEKHFILIGERFQAQWSFRLKRDRLRMGIMVSKPDHCLAELLYRWQSGDLYVNIPFVISNHLDSKVLVDHYRIPFYHVPTADEGAVLKVVKEASDFLVLARYMQILSKNFLNSYGKDIINIHHSFLPSFAGARPYKQAYERGVKLIGATAHYVTATLDDGPIIEQMVIPVTHRDQESSLLRKGKNLEKLTLCQAIHEHIEHRIICYKNRTIVFSQ